MVYRVPVVGDVVIARVEKISQTRGAECSVLAMDEQQTPFGVPLRGTIRPTDIASPGIQLEFSDLANCFRPGDLVRSKVISLGDSKGYFLSTLSQNCGVLCGDFNSTRPLSYKLLGHSDGSVHRRKVAFSTQP